MLIDTARVPALLAAEQVQVTVSSAFGTEQLPTGLRVLIGRHTAQPTGTVATGQSHQPP